MSMSGLDTTRFTDYTVTREIDWARMFGQPRDPRITVARIRQQVAKMRSWSEAGRRAILEERCLRVGVTVAGLPCFRLR